MFDNKKDCVWLVRKIDGDNFFDPSRDMETITCQPRESKKGGKYDYDYYGGYGY